MANRLVGSSTCVEVDPVSAYNEGRTYAPITR